MFIKYDYKSSAPINNCVVCAQKQLLVLKRRGLNVNCCLYSKDTSVFCFERKNGRFLSTQKLKVRLNVHWIL